MLGKIAVQAISRTVKVGCFLCYLPFEWDNKTNTIQLVKSRWRQYSHFIISVCQITHTVFAFLRIYQLILLGRVNLSELMLQLTITVSSALSTSNQINNWLFGPEMVDFVNKFLAYEQNLTRIYQTATLGDGHFELFLVFLGCSGCFEIPSLAFLYLIRSDSPIYIVSLIPHQSRWTKFYFLPYELVTNVGVVLNLLLYCFIFMSFLWSESFWLEQLRCADLVPFKQRSTCVRTYNSFRSPSNLIRTYRGLQVCMSCFHSATKCLALPSQNAVTLILTAIGLFGTIRFHNLKHVNFISYSVFPVGFIIMITWVRLIYPTAALIHDNSTRFRLSWMASLNAARRATRYSSALTCTYAQGSCTSYYFQYRQKEFVRFLRSCRNIKTENGSFFYYKKSTMAVIIDASAIYSMTLLVGF